MKTRIITGIVAVLIFIPIIIFSDTFIFPLAMAMLSAVGAYEMAKCITGNTKTSTLCAVISGVLPLIYLSEDMAYLTAVFYVIAGISIVGGLITLRQKESKKTSTLIFAVGYVASAFALMSASRLFPNMAFLMIFVCSWVCDTAAYFTGRMFGKKKLAPKLSPKKTVEGAIGGTIFGGSAMVVYGLILKSKVETLIAFFFVGIAVAVFSQMGDLYASAYKRKFGIKDYGKIFPGHGGVMDRFDSVLGATIVFPVAFILVYFLGFWS